DLLRRAIPRATKEHIDRALEVLDEFRSAYHAGDLARWGALNWHFHAALYAPANRNLTMGVIQKLHHHSDRYFRIQLVLTNGGERATEEHGAIAMAVQKKDVKLACDLMRAHILSAGQSLLKLLEQQRAPKATADDLRAAR